MNTAFILEWLLIVLKSNFYELFCEKYRFLRAIQTDSVSIPISF